MKGRGLLCQSLFLFGFERLDHHRNDLKEIAADAVVGSLKDGSGFVLIDRNDALGILHTGKVLNGAGNTESYIDLGTDGLAGLPDLMIGREPAGVHSGTAAADYAAAQRLGKLLSQLDAGGNVLADAAADRYDDLSAGQINEILGSLDDLQNLGLEVGSRQFNRVLLHNDLIGFRLIERSALHNTGTVDI